MTDSAMPSIVTVSRVSILLLLGKLWLNTAHAQSLRPLWQPLAGS